MSELTPGPESYPEETAWTLLEEAEGTTWMEGAWTDPAHFVQCARLRLSEDETGGEQG